MVEHGRSRFIRTLPQLGLVHGWSWNMGHPGRYIQSTGTVPKTGVSRPAEEWRSSAAGSVAKAGTARPGTF